MHHDDSTDPESVWTDTDRLALGTLSPAREPSALLRARTIATLRDRGLLADPQSTPNASRPVQRGPLGTFGMAAAAVVIFVAGGATGYQLAVRTISSRSPSARIAAQPATATASPPTVDRHVVWF